MTSLSGCWTTGTRQKGTRVPCMFIVTRPTALLFSLCVCVLDIYNNNNNKHDNVYGAVIMAEPLREFTRFI